MLTEERKKEIFPYFAYLYTKENLPEKYGNVKTFEEWSDLLDENPEDAELIVKAASSLTDEQWEVIDAEYSKLKAPKEQVLKAKKGNYLTRLRGK